MLCSNPITIGNHAFGCGQCMACRFNARRVWAHRIMLEAAQHGDNAFVTLTYDDEHLPAGGTLEPKHLQDWFKRFRSLIAPIRIRYFAVGEYGDNSFRPHYHAALFGFPSCSWGHTRSERRTRGCCVSCNYVEKSWGMGSIMLGTLEPSSANYVAGYVTKKMTNAHDDMVRQWLNGRHPEFARMSLRPGIGCSAMDEVASEFMKFNLDNTQADVPSALRHGKKELPLGKYLRRQLRRRIGREVQTPKAVQLERSREMQEMFPHSKEDFTPLKSKVLERFQGKRQGFEGRTKIFKQRRKM